MAFNERASLTGPSESAFLQDSNEVSAVFSVVYKAAPIFCRRAQVRGNETA